MEVVVHSVMKDERTERIHALMLINLPKQLNGRP